MYIGLEQLPSRRTWQETRPMMCTLSTKRKDENCIVCLFALSMSRQINTFKTGS